MKLLKFTELIFYIALTNLIIYDFFPNTILSNVIPESWNIWLMIGVIVFGVIFRHNRDMDKTESVARQLFSFFYVFVLIIVLTLLGGSSVSGIGLRDIGFWIAAILGVWEMLTSIRETQVNKV